jgi:hypothetical protein
VQTVAWRSSDDKVATVSTRGVVTAKGYGTATITVPSVEDPTKRATCVVTVQKPVLVKTVQLPDPIVVFANGNGATSKDRTETVACTIKPSTATDETFNFSLDSSNKATAELTNDGKIKVVGVQSGTAKLTVRSNDGAAAWTSDVIVVDRQSPALTRYLINSTTLYSKLGSVNMGTYSAEQKITILGVIGNTTDGWYYVTIGTKTGFIRRNTELTEFSPFEIYINNLKKLEMLIEESRAFYPAIPDNAVVAMNILRGQGGYTGVDWTYIAGITYSDIAVYVKYEVPTLLDYFSTKKTLVTPGGSTIDIAHFMVTLSGQYYYTSFDTVQLSGWAGDLQSVIYDLKRETWKSPEKDKKAIAKILCGSTSTSMGSHFKLRDMIADVDARNISQQYSTSTRLSTMLTNYYSGNESQRYSIFVNSYGGLTKLEALANEYTYPEDTVLKHLILRKYANSAVTNFELYTHMPPDPHAIYPDESQALTYGFIEFFKEKLK